MDTFDPPCHDGMEAAIACRLPAATTTAANEIPMRDIGLPPT
jgi:hypothetical protein